MKHKLIVKCVNAHDRCEGTISCPYCEPVFPLRTEDGRFAKVKYDETETSKDP